MPRDHQMDLAMGFDADMSESVETIRRLLQARQRLRDEAQERYEQLLGECARLEKALKDLTGPASEVVPSVVQRVGRPFKSRTGMLQELLEYMQKKGGTCTVAELNRAINNASDSSRIAATLGLAIRRGAPVEKVERGVYRYKKGF